MNKTPNKGSLSSGRRRLVEVMQLLNFGRIEGLAIKGGEPMFDPAPRIIRDVKLGGANGPRLESGIADFVLKDSVVELFNHLTRIGDGTLESLEIKGGV